MLHALYCLCGQETKKVPSLGRWWHYATRLLRRFHSAQILYNLIIAHILKKGKWILARFLQPFVPPEYGFDNFTSVHLCQGVGQKCASLSSQRKRFWKGIAIHCMARYNVSIQYQQIVKTIIVAVLQSVQRYPYLWALFYIYALRGKVWDVGKRPFLFCKQGGEERWSRLEI